MAEAGLPNFEIDDEIVYPDYDSDEELLAICDEYDLANLTTVEETTTNPSRFATIGQGQLNEIVDNAQAKGTKKATKWAVNVFKGQKNTLSNNIH